MIAQSLFDRAQELIQRIQDDLLTRKNRALELSEHEGTLQLLRSLDTDTPDLLELSELLEIINKEVLRIREFEKKYIGKHLQELVVAEMARGGHTVARETVAQALNLGTKSGLTVEEVLEELDRSVEAMDDSDMRLLHKQKSDLRREIHDRLSRIA